MAKKDFDKYLNGMRITVAEDSLALTKIKEACAIGETDEIMVKAAEKAFNDDRYRLEILLFAKGLLDRPTRKSKVNKWEQASKLPNKMPTKEQHG